MNITEPYSWSYFVSTSRNHCCAFFDKFLTATSNAKPLIAFRGLTVYSGYVFKPSTLDSWHYSKLVYTMLHQWWHCIGSITS